jgi:hypothetical protein
MKKVAISLLLVVLIAGVFFLLQWNGIKNDEINGQIDEDSGQPNIEADIQNSFEDSELGFRFEYRVSPRGYILEELLLGEKDNPDIKKAIILTRISDYEELQNSIVGREGPPNMNVLIFESKDSDLEEWLLRKSLFTNYKKNAGKKFSIGRTEGIKYSWDGLYQGETVAVLKNEMIYLFTSSYLRGVDDGRQADFKYLLESVLFDPQ